MSETSGEEVDYGSFDNVGNPNIHSDFMIAVHHQRMIV
jgi:hypothetical protein